MAESLVAAAGTSLPRASSLQYVFPVATSGFRSVNLFLGRVPPKKEQNNQPSKNDALFVPMESRWACAVSNVCSALFAQQDLRQMPCRAPDGSGEVVQGAGVPNGLLRNPRKPCKSLGNPREP